MFPEKDEITCHGDWHILIVIMNILFLMMMMMIIIIIIIIIMRRRILEYCLLHQNLQTFLDVEIVVEEIKVDVMKNKEVMLSPRSTVEDLQKIGRDGTIWQLDDTGNNAPNKEIHDVDWM
jgi:hypothetical protein